MFVNRVSNLARNSVRIFYERNRELKSGSSVRTLSYSVIVDIGVSLKPLDKSLAS